MFPKPLAELLRPIELTEVLGQEHLTSPGKALNNMVQSRNLQSMILWGPPGTGKTTLAHIMAQSVGLPFYFLSAIQAGVKDVKEIISRATEAGRVVLFLDEIHRFNKSQQDALLGAVESGVVILIGATTENPSFEVNSALLSRCHVFTLKPLDAQQLRLILEKAIKYLNESHHIHITIADDTALLLTSGGDARRLINLLELVIIREGSHHITITNQLVEETLANKTALYDKNGEQHYDIISAFIKSIRGSDPNAAVYWLARMLEGGEDVKFISRRMLILAAEDIGNANPNALLLANACFQAVSVVGMPEARIILSQVATYLASSPKSNAAYLAIEQAIAAVKKTGDLPVPLHLRNAPTSLMKDLQYGAGYLYAHDFENNFVRQEYMPEQLSGTVFYSPGNNAREHDLRQYLKKRWEGKYDY